MLKILEHTNLLYQHTSNPLYDEWETYSFYDNQKTELVGKITFRKLTVDDSWEFDYSEKTTKFVEDNLEKFVLLEYIHVESNMRNKGYGKKMMDFFVKQFRQPILVYVNPYDIQPKSLLHEFKTEILPRFYQNYDFTMIDKDFYIRPYGKKLKQLVKDTLLA